MFNVIYIFVFALGCVNASLGVGRSDAMDPATLAKLIDKVQKSSDEKMVTIGKITITTDGFVITEEMQGKIQENQEINRLLDQIEELEIGKDGLAVQISDTQLPGGLLGRAYSTSSLITTASIDGVLLEGNETESIESETARKKLKKILVTICNNNPKLGKWTITLQQELGRTKTIQLTFEEEHSDTESTGSGSSSH